MPIYIFEHPESQEKIEVLQKMTDPHLYVDEKGVEWKRIFTTFNAAIDTRPDIFSSHSLAASTNNKKESYEDLVERSKEASAKRAEKLGTSAPIKQTWYDNYAKKRNGVRHHSDPKFNSGS